jgi:hypothetical protein
MAGIILSLFDYTGNWSRPYREAGYPVIQMDKLHGDELLSFDYTRIPQGSVHGILAALPCTHFSRVAAPHWAAMDADGRTERSIQLANRIMDLIDYHAPAWWCIENPEGRLGQLVPRIGQQRITSFNPHEFGDPYSKKTVLFGTFNPLFTKTRSKDIIKGKGDDHSIDRYSRQAYKGVPRHIRRSITPMGFARAFFQSNP